MEYCDLSRPGTWVSGWSMTLPRRLAAVTGPAAGVARDTSAPCLLRAGYLAGRGAPWAGTSIHAIRLRCARPRTCLTCLLVYGILLSQRARQPTITLAGSTQCSTCCPPARLPACPPARLPACPPARGKRVPDLGASCPQATVGPRCTGPVTPRAGRARCGLQSTCQVDPVGHPACPAGPSSPAAPSSAGGSMAGGREARSSPGGWCLGATYMPMYAVLLVQSLPAPEHLAPLWLGAAGNLLLRRCLPAAISSSRLYYHLY